MAGRAAVTGVSSSRSVFLPGFAATCMGNVVSDATGRLLDRPNEVYELPQHAHRIRTEVRFSVSPERRPAPPYVQALGCGRSAALSSNPCA
jgi:hypothetical protein